MFSCIDRELILIRVKPSESEIRDINRYVKKLKDEGVLIDWWDEETKYCFEVKE
jgi:acetolactate synthase small subunit